MQNYPYINKEDKGKKVYKISTSNSEDRTIH